MIFRNIILILLFITLVPANSFARASSGKIVLKKKFTDFSTFLKTDYRYDEDGLYYRHYDFGVKIPFAQGWSTSLSYRSTYKFKTKHKKWALEKRPHITLEKTFNNEFIKTKIRTRQEYRYKSDGTQSTRNRFMVMLKSNKEFFWLKPFIGNEIAYDMDEEKYNKNWLSGGVEFPKTKFGKYSLYYRHITDLEEHNIWSSDYSVVFKAIYSF